MGAGSKVFYAIGTFLALMAVAYIVSTSWIGEDAYLFGLEWVGGVALVLATALCFMMAVYLNFTERRMDVLPEDWEEAEIEDGAGVLGFFSPHSIWPFAMSGAIFFLGLGIAFYQLWLIAFGAVFLIWTTTQLNLQYGIPREKH
ncbi:cytochrome C oxidase subunit [Corynebacterium imitans]|uniref:Cytochrome c oxidase polypeptide 4 n=1 Tax=Corynebacterium imitans TaxID=156978 RepID=A0A076NNV2_9CORY|nr:cytochrome c oxidase subunit 4 [Corynebacterium imitans]AIJ33911.1 cytochrome C oxidase [Corynebacterium imitans]MCG7279377.1 cytochrome c oxidase subunit 4 [Corynebacterium imitans]MDK8305778.1 cytochrome c oxidase subunit 4 [Corynebacterium imitans]MDK8636756.1 cytochrome c oxidase subunit 4 [Corynebacterium imitans]MDK8772371.1 cytochrome c oxidase subunit 4 [Corynebacterium imitans]